MYKLFRHRKYGFKARIEPRLDHFRTPLPHRTTATNSDDTNLVVKVDENRDRLQYRRRRLGYLCERKKQGQCYVLRCSWGCSTTRDGRRETCQVQLALAAVIGHVRHAFPVERNLGLGRH